MAKQIDTEAWACCISKIDWVRTHVSYAETILDVGAASGVMWKDTPLKVTTLDKDPLCNPDIVGEAENLPVSDNSFDIVCLCELLEHVPNPNIVLREAVRVARLKVIITVPWEHAWSRGKLPFTHKFHVRFYTPASLEEELQKIGLPFQIIPILLYDQGSENERLVWLGAEIYCCGDKK